MATTGVPGPHVVDAHSDGGPVRTLNEDFVVTEPGFWAIGDIGSGGFLQAADVRGIADVAAGLVRQRLAGQPGDGDAFRALVLALHLELTCIIAGNWRLKGAGVSLTALWWPVDDEVARVAQVGEGQAYLVGADSCTLLLPPHQLGRLWVRPGTVVAPGPRAVDTLGIVNTAPQIEIASLSPGEQAIALVSDGVHIDGTGGPVAVDQLADIVRREENPARRLVATAIQRATRDNCAAIVVRRPRVPWGTPPDPRGG